MKYIFSEMKSGIERIKEERERQVTEEGWTPEHDNEHKHYELSKAAVAYLKYNFLGIENDYMIRTYDWPWDPMWWKPSDKSSIAGQIKNLTKAGALIAAEIDRLQRLKEE